MIWCPYAGKEVSKSNATVEHIIPLSLGGSNQFTILVDQDSNSKAGSKIDAAIANNFLTQLKRQYKDVRGHSNTPPKATIKNSSIGEDQRPIQATFNRSRSGKNSSLIIWDSVERKNIPDCEIAGKTITSTFSFGIYDDLSFVAKVVLGTGYFMFGEAFKKHAKHDEIRLLLNADNLKDEETMRKTKTTACTRFLGQRPEDAEIIKLQKAACKAVGGSCVITDITKTMLRFSVGILGDWLGTICVPAEGKFFPHQDEYDLGRVAVINKRTLTQVSYKTFLEQLQIHLFGDATR